jgi:ubiquinone/menaquinone biosynthesis C-methylase UbiE
MPAIEQWNHNNHYHDFLLNQLPPGIKLALDVGCGLGFFAARLARLSENVDAVDVDRSTLDRAIQLHAQYPNIRFICGGFASLQLTSNHYDVITSLAALHHMDLQETLAEMKRVLRPGGVMLILGLYREASAADLAVSAAAIPFDLIHKHIIHRHEKAGLAMTAPIQKPMHSLSQIKKTAAAVLPGADFKRHLFWRYSLIWHKPDARELLELEYKKY